MKIVLDTNVVLDLYVFRDERVRTLNDAIAEGKVQWLATAAMREELACVLAYEQIAVRMDAADVSPHQVLAAFDEHAIVLECAPGAKCKCRDGDDQKFIDLAVAHAATLLSKDKAVLALKRKLAMLDVSVVQSM